MNLKILADVENLATRNSPYHSTQPWLVTDLGWQNSRGSWLNWEKNQKGGALDGKKSWGRTCTEERAEGGIISSSEKLGERIWESVDMVCAAVHIHAQIPVVCVCAEWWWWSMECEARLSGIEPSMSRRTIQSKRVMYCLNRVINQIEYRSDLLRRKEGNRMKMFNILSMRWLWEGSGRLGSICCDFFQLFDCLSWFPPIFRYTRENQESRRLSSPNPYLSLSRSTPIFFFEVA